MSPEFTLEYAQRKNGRLVAWQIVESFPSFESALAASGLAIQSDNGEDSIWVLTGGNDRIRKHESAEPHDTDGEYDSERLQETLNESRDYGHDGREG